VALQELWDLMGTAESALSAISIMVVVTGLMGMLIMLLAGLGERRREMAILRSVGARPWHVFGLLVAEAAALTAAGALLGLVLLYVGLIIAQPIVSSMFGLYLAISPPTGWDLTLLGFVLLAGLFAGTVPAWMACRQSFFIFFPMTRA
ncbi:MAG: ABC transporter permease, partial [Pseudomonadota bacterium]